MDTGSYTFDSLNKKYDRFSAPCFEITIGGTKLSESGINVTTLEVEPSVHRPPRVKVEWASLQFTGFLASCQQQFIKFDENGSPVRAKLICQFIENLDLDIMQGTSPRESPDTTKYRRVKQGDSLWAMSADEYGECGQWRVIAAANGLTNPRLLRTGDLIALPALEKE